MNPDAPGWELQGEDPGGGPLRIAVTRLPWRIGREADNDLVLATGGISRHHAELRRDATGQLRLLDHDSRNGSFVNGLRVIGSSAPLVGGELLQLGAAAFVLHSLAGTPALQGADAPAALAAQRQPLHASALRELLDGRGLLAAWQPMCATEGGWTWGGELLGRADHPQLPGEPLPLFDLAAQFRCEAALSQAWRPLSLSHLAAWKGPLQTPGAEGPGDRPPVFLNVHPREPLDERLLDSLQTLADAHPEWQLVMELQPARLHEEELPGFVHLLEVIGLQWGLEHLERLSPDAGSAVAALMPDYLKLAPRMVRRLRGGDVGHLRLLVKWQTLAEALGARLVAVGVERRETLALCRNAGLRWVQGYLSGAPLRLPLPGAVGSTARG